MNMKLQGSIVAWSVISSFNFSKMIFRDVKKVHINNSHDMFHYLWSLPADRKPIIKHLTLKHKLSKCNVTIANSNKECSNEIEVRYAENNLWLIPTVLFIFIIVGTCGPINSSSGLRFLPGRVLSSNRYRNATSPAKLIVFIFAIMSGYCNVRGINIKAYDCSFGHNISERLLILPWFGLFIFRSNFNQIPNTQ